MIIIIVIGAILITTHDGSNYKSEWSTNDGYGLTVFLTMLISCFIAILSLTILLNNSLSVSSNTFLSFTTRFLLPGIVCLIFIYEEKLNFMGKSDLNGSYPGDRLIDGYILSMGIIHLLSLTKSYKHFRSNLSKNTLKLSEPSPLAFPIK